MLCARRHASSVPVLTETVPAEAHTRPMPTHMAALDGPELVDADELDRFVGPKIRARLEERYWQPIERATSAESFLDDEAFFADPSGHPATFSDHGVVHVRDVARQAIRLAEELNGGLLPSRCDDRLRVIQGSAVLMAYLHDIGMVAATPAGRRVHAQFAAQTALGAGFDDLAEELWSSGAAGLRTRIEADTAGGADVAGDVVLREVLALSVCHSKSAVPAQLLDDPAALRRLMLRATFTDLDKQTAASNEAWWTAGRDTSAPSSAVARYRNVDADAFAWLVDPRPAARRFVTDVIDAIRVLRAADALRQRGTTQRTSAGYEVCVDHRSGRAVMALRSDDRRFGAWMWLDNRHSIAEGNLRVVDLTLEGSLRVAFDRGSFGGHGATERVAVATADMIADIEADVLGSFPRRPGAPRSARLVEIVAPPDDASFARLVVDALERRHPQLARTTVVVDQPHPTPPVEAAGWHRRAAAATIDHSEVEGWFEQLSLHGLRVDALDRQAALRDALHVRLRPGEVGALTRKHRVGRADPARTGPRRRADRRLPTRAAPAVAPDRRHRSGTRSRTQRRRDRRRRGRRAGDPRRDVPRPLVQAVHRRRTADRVAALACRPRGASLRPQRPVLIHVHRALSAHRQAVQLAYITPVSARQGDHLRRPPRMPRSRRRRRRAESVGPGALRRSRRRFGSSNSRSRSAGIRPRTGTPIPCSVAQPPILSGSPLDCFERDELVVWRGTGCPSLKTGRPTSSICPTPWPAR